MRPVHSFVAIAMLATACTGAGSPGTTGAQASIAPSPTAPASAASPGEFPASPLVGTWTRLTTCEEFVQAQTQAGFEEFVLDGAAGNGWLPGVTDPAEIADPKHPCDGALPREHSHFFTEDGRFGSLDWNGDQVDDGTYVVADDVTIVIPYGFDQAPPIQVQFRYRIAGDAITFDPVIPSDCSTDRCREAASWSVAVAYAGKPWKRIR